MAKPLATIDPLARVKSAPLEVKHLMLNPAAARNQGIGLYDALPEFPSEIFACKNLVKLEVFRGIRGSVKIPAALGQLRKLTSLSLGGMTFTEIPASLGKLVNLETLELRGSDKLKTLPKSIGKLAKLRTLSLGSVMSFASLPAEIGKLRELRQLGIGTCKLSSVPKTLWQLTKLERLHLPASVRTVPPGLGALTKLRYLAISGRALASIGPELGRLTELRELVVYGPATTLPESIGALSKLRTLHAYRVGLTSLPLSFTKLRALVELDLTAAALPTAVEILVTLPALKSVKLAETPIPRDERNAIIALMKLAPGKRAAQWKRLRPP